MTTDWFRVHMAGEVAHVSIFGTIGFGSQSVADLIFEIGQATSVELIIDCNGGDGHAAFEVYDAIRDRCTLAVVKSRCYSASNILLLAADKTECFSDSKFLLHSCQKATLGGRAEHRAGLRSIDEMNHRVADLLASRTGKNISELVDFFTGEDKYLTAQEALDFGLIDEILPAPEIPVSEATEATEDFVTEDDGSEQLLYDLIRAAGPIRVKDRKTFARNLSTLLTSQVSEK